VASKARTDDEDTLPQADATGTARQALVHRLRSGRRVFALASLLLGALAIGWLVWRNASSWPLLWQSMRPAYLAAAFVAYSLALLVASYVWHRQLVVLEGGGSLGRDVRIYVATAFARRLPGSLWGPALRMYWYRRLGGDWRIVGVVSLLEVWSLTIAGALVAAVGLVAVVNPNPPFRVWLAGALALVLVGAVATPRVAGWLIRLGLRVLRSPTRIESNALRPAELVRWIGLGVANWIFGGLELAAILRALTPYRLDTLPTIVTDWALAGLGGALITFVPGGFGVVELALTGLLALSFPMPIAVAAALGLRVFTTAGEAAWALLGFAVPTVIRRISPLASRQSNDALVRAGTDR
jgi:uncharacterized membrane protein YbhN (UPF0104 family)